MVKKHLEATVFKMFILGGISLDVRSEILFWGDTSEEENMISDSVYYYIPMPILMYF